MITITTIYLSNLFGMTTSFMSRQRLVEQYSYIIIIFVVKITQAFCLRVPSATPVTIRVQFNQLFD